jgi:glutathione synthase/RimK-type ligase-like ATP-grasp enzyme
VEWEAYDAVVVRSVWDYFERLDEFLAWVDRVGPAAQRFLNPPPIVSWNAHKTYLRDLGERGVPVVDTVWVDRGEPATVPFEEAIVKPAVSGGSVGLRRASGGEEVVAEEDLMIQPLMRSIETEGELSLLFAGGLLSHVVRKVPAEGDIRSQPEFGSRVAAEPPTGEMLEVSAMTLEAIGDDLPYARVDLVRAADGTLRLIELEVIEPQLYLRWDEESPVRFASALAAAVRSA